MVVYRFIDIEGNIIYVGRSSKFERRIKYEHFTDRGHLPEECYREAKRIEYAEVNTLNESKVYELYLIDKYKPKYNNIDIAGGSMSFQMPELEWLEYVRDTRVSSRLTKAEITELFKEFGDAVEDDCSYIGNYLRDKDRVTWLHKLSPEEQNEYLGIIYTLERFSDGIRELKDDKLGSLLGNKTTFRG